MKSVNFRIYPNRKIRLYKQKSSLQGRAPSHGPKFSNHGIVTALVATVTLTFCPKRFHGKVRDMCECFCVLNKGIFLTSPLESPHALRPSEVNFSLQ